MLSLFLNLSNSLRSSLGTAGCAIVAVLVSVLGIGLILALAGLFFGFSLFGAPTPSTPLGSPAASVAASASPAASLPIVSPSATSSAPEREAVLLPASPVQAFGIDQTTFTANWYVIPPAGIVPNEFLVVVNGETVGSEPYVGPGDYNFAVTGVPCGATFTLQIIAMAGEGTSAPSETYQNVTNPC